MTNNGTMWLLQAIYNNELAENKELLSFG